MEPEFKTLGRQQFRRYFQPSRILICVLPDPSRTAWNLITVSFNMSCSYDPPMIAMAIHNINRSYQLVQAAAEYVLAVPGERLADETMRFGWNTSRDENKIKESGIELVPSDRVDVPGLRNAIANIEVRKVSTSESGDHIVVIGEVLRFGVNIALSERNLLSVGPDTAGFRVLRHQGIHRIAVVDTTAPRADPFDE